MFTGAQRRASSFGAFVTGTFAFGWVIGLLTALKLWQLWQARQGLGFAMWNGVGHVAFMLVPAAVGVVTLWASGRLVARGWGGAPLRLAALGVCGLVAGLLAL